MSLGFNKKLLQAIVCPQDKEGLSLTKIIRDNKEVIFEGELFCAKCQQKYYIKSGILYLLTQQAAMEDIMHAEMLARNKQTAEYDKRLVSRYQKEMPSTLKMIGNLQGKQVIEYGCGTGRVTSIMADSADLILAIDFSLDSLKFLAEKIQDQVNVGLVWADAVSFQTTDNFFDLGIAIQFYEHIPTVNLRHAFLNNLSKSLRFQGEMIMSVYHYDFRRDFKHEAKEGKHQSGIFFHYFSKQDLKKEIQKFFLIQKIKLIDITLPGEMRLNLSAPLAGKLSNLLEFIPGLNKFAHLLLVKARKNNSHKDFEHYQRGLFGGFFFVKHWFWFIDPFELKKSAMVNFFSYNKSDLPSWQRRDGLTTIVDLKPELADIWKKFRPNFIAKQIEKAQANKIIVKEIDDFSGFKKVYKNFRNANNLPKDNINILKGHSVLLAAYHEGQMIAGGIFITNHQYWRAYILSSWISEQNGKNRELLGQANRLLIWESIRLAKNRGCEYLDLGGISPESLNKKLVSLAEFKEAFGGERKACYYYFKVYSPLLKFWLRLRGFKNI